MMTIADIARWRAQVMADAENTADEYGLSDTSRDVMKEDLDRHLDNFIEGVRNLMVANENGVLKEKDFKEYLTVAWQQNFRCGYELGIDAVIGRAKELPDFLTNLTERE